MGKIKFALAAETNQTIRALASFDYGHAETVDPARDFLVAGTNKDIRNKVKFDVSGNDLK